MIVMAKAIKTDFNDGVLSRATGRHYSQVKRLCTRFIKGELILHKVILSQIMCTREASTLLGLKPSAAEVRGS